MISIYIKKFLEHGLFDYKNSGYFVKIIQESMPFNLLFWLICAKTVVWTNIGRYDKF